MIKNENVGLFFFTMKFFSRAIFTHIYLLVCSTIGVFGHELNHANFLEYRTLSRPSIQSLTKDADFIKRGDSLLPSIEKSLKLSAFIDFYYSNDLKSKLQNRTYGNMVSYTRLGEPQLNLAMVKLNFEEDGFRANLAMGLGSFMINNMGHEPAGLRNVFEANAGIQLAKKGNVWFDIGVMPSHIGFESGIGYECLNLTRSLLAENSPYYESGARLVGEFSGVNWGAYVLNGWQSIYRNQYNLKGVDFGAQINKKWQHLELNYSNIFVGVSQNDVTQRIFHNWYAKYQMKKNWNLILGFDIGKQKSGNSNWYSWQSPVCIVVKQVGKHRLAGRYERYLDPWDIMMANLFPAGSFSSVKLIGYSLNYDYQVKKNVLLRFESRYLKNEMPYLNFALENTGDPRKTMLMFTAALQAKF